MRAIVMGDAGPRRAWFLLCHKLHNGFETTVWTHRMLAKLSTPTMCNTGSRVTRTNISSSRSSKRAFSSIRIKGLCTGHPLAKFSSLTAANHIRASRQQATDIFTEPFVSILESLLNSRGR